MSDPIIVIRIAEGPEHHLTVREARDVWQQLDQLFGPVEPATAVTCQGQLLTIDELVRYYDETNCG
jgi:hypothetical protein